MQHTCKLVADLTLFQNNKILLLRYKNINKYDHQQGWFLPDDLLLNFEHPESAAKRISKEQLGIKPSKLELSYIESFKGNDESWHLVFHFKSNLDEAVTFRLSQDINEAKLFEPKNLPKPEEVAHHGWALAVISRITKKLMLGGSRAKKSRAMKILRLGSGQVSEAAGDFLDTRDSL